MKSFYVNAFIHRGSVYYTGYENGERVKRKVSYEPYIFLPDTSKTFGTFQNPNPPRYETLEGRPVRLRKFSNIPEANKFLKEHRGIDNFEYYGNTNWLYTWLNDAFPGKVEFDSSLINVIHIDIEVESDRGLPQYRNPIHPITAITMSKRGKKITFGCKPYTPKSKNVAYVPCKDEEELLKKFLRVWNDPHYNPDVITGWNVELFDIPYLYNRIKALLGKDTADTLSPWGLVEEKSVERKYKDTPDLIYDIKGVATLDYMILYKKFSFKNQESFALDYIANAELGEKKLDYSEYESLLRLYRENYELFIDYNIRDVELVEKLDDKLKIIEQVFTLAYDGKVTYGDTLTTLRLWDTVLHNDLLSKNIVVPQGRRNDEEELIGAYVIEPQAGLHKWVVSFDLTSLYPHIIIQYNISPETYLQQWDNPYGSVQGAIEKMVAGEVENKTGQAVTANLCLYRKDIQGFIPRVIEQVYNDRAAYKKAMIGAKKEYEKTKDPEVKKKIAQYDYLQMAKKIQINGLYGALANRYFRFYDHDNAEAVTTTGQFIIKRIVPYLNAYLNKILKTNKDYVIAGDTDSLHVTLDDLVKSVGLEDADEQKIVDFLDKSAKQLLKVLDVEFERIAKETNAMRNAMILKREYISNKGIWTTKKKYILNVLDAEGVRYTEPEMVIKGLESVRSDTPSACRDAIKKVISIILNEDQASLIKYVKEFRQEFEKMPIRDIAFNKSISGLNDYKDAASIYGKSTPLQVKSALIYNHLLKEKGLDKTYPLIYNGDKVKYVYLKAPNPLHQRSIAFVQAVPEEFNVSKYLDYDVQFEKGFKTPVERLTDIIGWKIEEVATLEEWI